SSKCVRPRSDQLPNRLVVPGGEILLHLSRELRRPLPLDARLLHRRIEALRRIAYRLSVVRQQAFEVADDDVARRRLLLQRNLVAMLVPVEEAIARAAEPLPDGFGFRLPHGSDRLPLGLQALELRGGILPVG